MYMFLKDEIFLINLGSPWVLTSVLSRIPDLCGRWGSRQRHGIESKTSPAGELTQKVLLTRGEGHKEAEGGDGD